jgi:hypothetical protein
LNCIVFASAIAFSFFWHLPVRAGLLFVSVDTFIASVGIVAYLMLLTTLVHPAIAVTLALVFNGDLFYNGYEWTQSVIRAGNSNVWLRILDHLFHYLYFILPMVYAFAKKTEHIYSSFRVLNYEWKYRLYSFGYVIVFPPSATRWRCLPC